MNKENPIGSGALSMNRNGDYDIGTNSVTLGSGCIAQDENAISMGNACSASAKDSIALGNTCQSLKEGSITQGKGLVANSANQIVQGKYNTIGNYAYILGGGTSLSNTKNIFTVDWDGNAKAKTFTSEGNIISNNDVVSANDVIYNSDKSLIELDETVSSNKFRLDALETDVSLLHGIKITGIQLYTSESDAEIEYGKYAEFSQFVTYKDGEQWLFIPRGMNQWSGGLDVGSVSGTGNTAQLTFKLQNIDHANKSSHKVKVAWYYIRYTTI